MEGLLVGSGGATPGRERKTISAMNFTDSESMREITGALRSGARQRHWILIATANLQSAAKCDVFHSEYMFYRLK
jgi:hypothetical protein